MPWWCLLHPLHAAVQYVSHVISNGVGGYAVARSMDFILGFRGRTTRARSEECAVDETPTRTPSQRRSFNEHLE
jgi:hypothetical protein